MDFKKRTNSCSVMIARAAQQNCSVFRKEGKLDADTVIVSFLRYAVRYDNYVSNVKYTLQQMLGCLQEAPRGRKLLAAQSVNEIWYNYSITLKKNYQNN
jgi:tRNA-dihydrouridine synthase 2